MAVTAELLRRRRLRSWKTIDVTNTNVTSRLKYEDS